MVLIGNKMFTLAWLICFKIYISDLLSKYLNISEIIFIVLSV